MNNYRNYLPQASLAYIKEITHLFNLEIIVKRERKTRHGDFKVNKEGLCFITINSNLNKYRFLITLIHEISHFYVFNDYGNTVKPHGIEWKNYFRKLFMPVLNINCFPPNIVPLLAKYFKNPKASSDTDVDLVRALKKYDRKNNQLYIYNLRHGDIFESGKGKIFKFDKKLVKRYKCLEIKSNKYYLFNANSEIKKLDEKKSCCS